MELNWNTYQAHANSELELAEGFVSDIKAQFDLNFHANKSAVYLMSSNAGSFSSIAFWKNALEHSPRFANPGIFPWTLANATAGCIARAFSINGPNYTIIENELDANELISLYQNDQQKYNLMNAFLITWELKTNGNQIAVRANWTIIE